MICRFTIDSCLATNMVSHEIRLQNSLLISYAFKIAKFVLIHPEYRRRTSIHRCIRWTSYSWGEGQPTTFTAD